MYLVLVLVGVVLAAVGVAMMRYAVPIEEMSSVALFVSGVVAIVGALVIGALAVVARSLSRIAERMEIQPLPVPPVAAVGHEDPAPRPARQPARGSRRGREQAFAARLVGTIKVRQRRLGRRIRPPHRRSNLLPGEVDLAPLTRVADRQHQCRSQPHLWCGLRRSHPRGRMAPRTRSIAPA